MILKIEDNEYVRNAKNIKLIEEIRQRNINKVNSNLNERNRELCEEIEQSLENSGNNLKSKKNNITKRNNVNKFDKIYTEIRRKDSPLKINSSNFVKKVNFHYNQNHYKKSLEKLLKPLLSFPDKASLENHFTNKS